MQPPKSSLHRFSVCTMLICLYILRAYINKKFHNKFNVQRTYIIIINCKQTNIIWNPKNAHNPQKKRTKSLEDRQHMWYHVIRRQDNNFFLILSVVFFVCIYLLKHTCGMLGIYLFIFITIYV